MGIRFLCPNGHRLNVKTFLAGERGICPECDARFIVPNESGGQVMAINETDLTTVAPELPLAPTESPVSTLEMPQVAKDEVQSFPSIVIDTGGVASDEAASVTARRRQLRERRERMKSVSLVLGGIVLLLTAVMVVVLLR
jgi:hypothetical protein